MEGTRSGRNSKQKRQGYNRQNRSYDIRNQEKEESNYKKSLFTLQIIICIGLFTIALLFKSIDSPFTNDLKAKVKTAISENVPIEELYNKTIGRLSSLLNSDNSEQVEESEAPTSEDLKKKTESQTPKLVPTLED